MCYWFVDRPISPSGSSAPSRGCGPPASGGPEPRRRAQAGPSKLPSKWPGKPPAPSAIRSVSLPSCSCLGRADAPTPPTLASAPPGAFADPCPGGRGGTIAKGVPIPGRPQAASDPPLPIHRLGARAPQSVEGKSTWPDEQTSGRKLKLISRMADSIYTRPDPLLRQFFDQAGSPEKVLCAPIDYAKAKHTVLFCNGRGDILKQPFSVANSPEGLELLLGQLKATCRHRGLRPQQAFFGGEDVPVWAENFITALRERGFPVARVNAWEAKRQRENFQASSDALDLHGIAQCLLKFRGKLTPVVSEDYRRLRDLCRERQRFVTAGTALTNRVHTYVDRLFPRFLDVKCSGIPPFSPACWFLLEDRFSAPEIARRRPQSLIEHLEQHGLEEAPAAVATLQAWARHVLPPARQYVVGWQDILRAIAQERRVVDQIIGQLDLQSATLLAGLPGAFLTSISGIGITLAAGWSSELGAPEDWPPLRRLCSYAGIIPGTEQTGGPDQPAHTVGVRPRCNHHLKNYILQAAMKMGQMGPAELQERYRQIEASDGAAPFALAKDLLSLGKALVVHQAVFLPSELYNPNSRQEDRAAYYRDLWPKLRAKWQPSSLWTRVFAPEAPLGQWRQMVQENYQLSLPLPQPKPSQGSAGSSARPSTPGASPARLK
jgi:transposase